MKRIHQCLDFCFPRFCVGCAQEGTYICASCRKSLLPHPDRCGFCHRVMSFGQTCHDCFPYHKYVKGIMVAFVYTHSVKKLIMHLKFYHKRDIASFLAKRLVFLIQSNPFFTHAYNHNKLFITYVPSHRYKKRFIKGYNQSELLARHVARILTVPLLHGLQKTKRTSSQTTKSRKERLTNLVDTFGFTKNTESFSLNSDPSSSPGKNILIIIDDITTTGATLEEVAKTRKKHYPELCIRGVVVGRHGK